MNRGGEVLVDVVVGVVVHCTQHRHHIYTVQIIRNMLEKIGNVWNISFFVLGYFRVFIDFGTGLVRSGMSFRRT